MIQEKNWYKNVMKISDVYNSIINFICVTLMCAQTVSIIVMVFGRYIFNKVPQWTEQFALFCMIWFAMFSIALAVRSDSHVKMEVVDKWASPAVLLGFKIFGNLCTMAFGIVLVIQYFSSVAGGFFMITNAIIYCIEITAKFIDEKKSKEVM